MLSAFFLLTGITTITAAFGATVTGKVVKADGTTGVADVEVDFYDPAINASVGNVSTDTDGNFNITLADGDYNVSLYDMPSNVNEAPPVGMTISITGSTFTFKGGNGSSTPQTASPVTIKLKTGTRISGKVVKADGTTGVSNAWVDFYDRNANSTAGGIDADASGNFSIALADGDYNVNVSNIPSNVDEAPPAGMTISITGSTFSFKGGNGSSTPQTASPVTIKLKTGTRISGKVVKADGTTGVLNAWVDFYDPNANASAGGASTDASGNFSVVLPNGDYNVNLNIPSNVVEATPAGMTINVTSTGFSFKGRQRLKHPTDSLTRYDQTKDRHTGNGAGGKV